MCLICPGVSDAPSGSHPFYFYYIFILFVCMCMCYSTHMEARRQLRKVVLSTQPVGPRDKLRSSRWVTVTTRDAGGAAPMGGRQTDMPRMVSLGIEFI